MRWVAPIVFIVLLAGCIGGPSQKAELSHTFSVQYEGQMGPGGNPSGRASSGIVWCDDGATPIVSAQYALVSGSLRLRLVTLNEESRREWTWNFTGPTAGDLTEVLPADTSNYLFAAHWGTDPGEIVRDGVTFSYPPASKGFDGRFVALAHCPDPDGVTGTAAR